MRHLALHLQASFSALTRKLARSPARKHLLLLRSRTSSPSCKHIPLRSRATSFSLSKAYALRQRACLLSIRTSILLCALARASIFPCAYAPRRALHLASSIPCDHTLARYPCCKQLSFLRSRARLLCTPQASSTALTRPRALHLASIFASYTHAPACSLTPTSSASMRQLDFY